MFIAALFKISRTWKQPRCPLTEMDKDNVVHIHSGILLSCKKQEVIPGSTTEGKGKMKRKEKTEEKKKCVYKGLLQ